MGRDTRQSLADVATALCRRAGGVAQQQNEFRAAMAEQRKEMENVYRAVKTATRKDSKG